MLSDKGDFTLPKKGIVTISDFETSKREIIDATCKKTRKFYSDHKKKGYKQTIDALSKAKTDVLEITTETSVADALSKYFIYKKDSNTR